jgi:hypothetical protein
MKLPIVFLLFLLALAPVGAESFTDNINWMVRGSILYFAADNGRQGADPAPILPSLGVSAEYPFWKMLSLELTEDIYFTNYEYNYDLGYAMACNPENRSAFVMGFITGVQLTGFFPVGEKGMRARVYGGPAMDLRFVVQAFGLHPDDVEDAAAQTNAIRKYFWSDGRWFFPVLGAGFDFPVNEKFLIGIDLRTWIPVYRLWADKDLPSIDGWRFGLGIRLTPRKKPAPPPPQETDSEGDGE